MSQLLKLGQQLRACRKHRFPDDNLADFSVRIGVSRATLQKMEAGDLSVSMDKYYAAAKVLAVDAGFSKLFIVERSLFDE